MIVPQPGDPVLTLKQPWADLVVAGVKPVERSRNADGTFAPEDETTRFLSLVKVGHDGCAIWNGGRWGDYGRFRRTQAHRWAYERWIGPIPDGHDLHHECEVKLCVNPEHLTPLSRRDHVRTVPGNPTVGNAEKVECVNGHPLAGTNLFRDSKGHRQCRRCERDRKAAFRERRRREGPFCACGKPVLARGMCTACYKRARRAS